MSARGICGGRSMDRPQLRGQGRLRVMGGNRLLVFLVIVVGLSLAIGSLKVAAQGETDQQQDTTLSQPTTEQAAPSQSAAPAQPFFSQSSPIPPTVMLELGDVKSFGVNDLRRVAIGNPEILDVSIVSPNEILLQAKATGATNLILWESTGQRTSLVQVTDPRTGAVQAQLNQLIKELNLPNVQVKREEGKIFLTGEAPRKEDVDRIDDMLEAFPGVTNLTRVPLPPLPSATPPLVKLTVQVIELTRSDLERLGVKWSSAVSLTEPEVTDLSFSNALFRWGTSMTRSSFSATLNALVEQNKARLLAEPKLVTASGKEASSFIGVEVPVLESTSASVGTSAVSTNVKFRKTGVLLKITPYVIDEHQITITIDAEVSSIDTASALNVPVGGSTVSVPGFNVRRANSEVNTVSGGTIFIAGLLQAEDTKNSSQVPALGSVPVFGRLFRSPEKKSTQRELVITVTPERLVDPEAPTKEKVAAVEQALSVAEVTASATPESEDNPTLNYAMQVQDRIARSIQYPAAEKEQGHSGQVKLRLHLFRDGTLERAIVSTPSGVQAFDQAALEAAQGQSPYPPFPKEIAQQELWLELPVLFRS